MTNQQILDKAIRKAIDGGWHNLENWSVIDLGANDVGIQYDDSHVVLPPEALIASKDFAKALWGEQLIQVINMEPAWRYHLQQMVIADDPIEYLGENI